MTNKICTKCDTEKSLDNFYFRKRDNYYFSECKTCAKLRIKNNYESKKEEKLLYAKNYRYINKDKIRDYKRNRELIDINYKLSCNLRKRLNKLVKRKNKLGSAVNDLGCTIQKFKEYLESKFLSGMTWENYGKWHIDHIKPLSKFDLTIREQLLQACHYTNLQPLWAEENIRKKNKFVG